jgi:hypothetical protein
VQADAKDVYRRLEQLRRDPGQERRKGAVGGDEPPVAVDREGGVGLVPGQHQLDRAPRRLECGVVQRPFGVERGEPGGGQERVAVAQRDLQPLGEAEQHLAAGLGAPGFEEADVAGGDVRLHREVELTQAPPLPPAAQQLTDLPGRVRGIARLHHTATIPRRAPQKPLPAR